MIKVMVVIYGLVLLVPGGHPDDVLTAVVLNTQNRMKHEPEFKQQAPMAGPAHWALDPGFEFVVQAPGEPGELVQLDEFVELASLTATPEQGYIRPECVEPDGDCTHGGENLVAGVFHFRGNWTSRAASYCGRWVAPVDDYDDAELDFRTEGGNVHRTQDRELATALVLETTLPSEDALDRLVERLGDQGVYLNLSKTKPGPCKRWRLDEDESCVVLFVGNPARNPPPCPDCRLDRHFSAFYDMTVGAADGDRYLPYLVRPDNSCLSEKSFTRWLKSVLGIRNDPSPRCPPPIGKVFTETAGAMAVP